MGNRDARAFSRRGQWGGEDRNLKQECSRWRFGGGGRREAVGG